MTRNTTFWLLVAATLAVYAAMLAWSLPTVARAAGGVTPFDLRPGGYSFEEARAFLAALTPDGKAFYLEVQQRLDLAFPALAGATLFFAIARLAPRGWGVWRWLLALTALPGAAFDYLENHAVASMLALGSVGITPDIVATASRWTVLKSQSITAAMVIMLALLLVWAAQRLRRRANRA